MAAARQQSAVLHAVVPVTRQFLVVHQVRIEGDRGLILGQPAKEVDPPAHPGQVQSASPARHEMGPRR